MPPSAQGDVAARVEAALGGPVCPRCRGVGDTGSVFCKFCGTRYDAEPSGDPALAATAPGPHEPGRMVTAVRAPGTPKGSEPAVKPRGFLVAILKDGSDGQAFPITGAQTDLGREDGDLLFADDPYMGRRHARISCQNDTFTLIDLDSVNGVYVRTRQPVDLKHGDMFLIGQQVLRFEVLGDGELPLGPATVHGDLLFGTPEVPRVARLVQVTTEGVGRDLYYLYRDETVLGRESGHIVFTEDAFLSRRHASISIDRANRRFVLKDLGSSNGTSIRMRSRTVLSHGDQFRVGRHLFRLDARGGMPA